MESLEKTTEEGFDFIKLFLLPISGEDYFLHKNQIDLFIRKFKMEHKEKVDQWKFEVKHILPATGKVSDASNFLMQEMLTEFVKIIEGEQDLILSVFSFALSKDRVTFQLNCLSGSLENYLFTTLGTYGRGAIIEKLCNSSLSSEAKFLLGVMMAPYIAPDIFLSLYLPSFLDGNLKIPTINTCDQLIDYAVSLGNHKDTYEKLSTMCQAILGGTTESNLPDVSTFIEESVDEEGNYDEVLAMKKINEYFSLHKNKEEAKQKKKTGEASNEKI